MSKKLTVLQPCPCPNYVILSTINNALCITAGASAGAGVTLTTYGGAGTATPYQVWTACFQVNQNGDAGIAVVNNAGATAPGAQLSVTSQGTQQQLVMQTFSPNSSDQDAWLLVPAGSPGLVRFVWPQSPNWSWNDQSGAGKAGDPILLWNDFQQNSVWTLKTYFGSIG